MGEKQYDFQRFLKIIKAFKRNGNYEKLTDIRTKFSSLYPLPSYLWIDWIKDEIKYKEYSINGTIDNENEYFKDGILRLFDRAVIDFQSVDIWLEYAQFGIGLMNSSLTEGLEKSREIFERALQYCGLHVTQGAIIWEGFREFEIALLSGYEERLQIYQSNFDNSYEMAVSFEPLRIEFNSQIQRVFNLFKRQLSIPLLGMEATLKEFEEWAKLYTQNISPNDLTTLQQNYELAQLKLSEILGLEDVIHATRSTINDIQNILDNQQLNSNHRREEIHKKNDLKLVLRDHYQTYLKYETKFLYSTKSNRIPFKSSPARISCLYERALSECPMDIKIWCQYVCDFLSGRLSDPRASIRLAFKAVRNFATSLPFLAHQPPGIEGDQDSSVLKLNVDNSKIEDFTNDLAKIWISILDSYEHLLGDDFGNCDNIQSDTTENADNHLVSQMPNEIDNETIIGPTVPSVGLSAFNISGSSDDFGKIYDINSLDNTNDLLQMIKLCMTDVTSLVDKPYAPGKKNFVRDVWLRLALKYCCGLTVGAIYGSFWPPGTEMFNRPLSWFTNGNDGVRRENLKLKRTQREALLASVRLTSLIWVAYLEHLRRYLHVIESNSSANSLVVKNFKTVFASVIQEACQYFDRIFGTLDVFPDLEVSSSPDYQDAVIPIMLFAATTFTYILSDREKSRHYWNLIVNNGGSYSSYNWVEWYNCEKHFGDNAGAKKLLLRALSYAMDNMDWIIEMIVRHDRIHGCDPQSWRETKKKLMDIQNRAEDKKRKMANIEKEMMRDKKKRRSGGSSSSGVSSSPHNKSPGARDYSRGDEPSSSHFYQALNSTFQSAVAYDTQQLYPPPYFVVGEDVIVETTPSKIVPPSPPPNRDRDGFAIPNIPRAYKKPKSAVVEVKKEDVLEEVKDVVTTTPVKTTTDSNDTTTTIDFSKVPERTLFLSNLSFKSTEGDLRTLFQGFGDIEYIHLVSTRKGKSKGYAYLVFKDPGSVIGALGCDRVMFKDRPVFVSRYGKRFSEERGKYKNHDFPGPSDLTKTSHYQLSDKFVDGAGSPEKLQSMEVVVDGNGENVSPLKSEINSKTGPLDDAHAKSPIYQHTKAVRGGKKEFAASGSPRVKLDLGGSDSVNRFLPRKLKGLTVSTADGAPETTKASTSAEANLEEPLHESEN